MASGSSGGRTTDLFVIQPHHCRSMSILLHSIRLPCDQSSSSLAWQSSHSSTTCGKRTSNSYHESYIIRVRSHDVGDNVKVGAPDGAGELLGDIVR